MLKTPAGFVFVDWESALLAPPERDLWALAESDPGVLDAYSAATGTAIDTDALTLRRMWYDLAEISGYVRWFRSGHDDTADAAEALAGPAGSSGRRQHLAWSGSSCADATPAPSALGYLPRVDVIGDGAWRRQCGSGSRC